MEKSTRKEVMHKIREGWRSCQWKEFQGKDRRDAKELRTVPYDGEKVRLARKAAAAGDTRRAHLMMGAFKSPMASRHWKEPKCCWEGCGCQVPTQDHVMWECRKRRAGAPGRPRDVVQARLGWPAGRDVEKDREILEYMEEVVQRVWDLRWDNEGQAQKREQKMAPWQQATSTFEKGISSANNRSSGSNSSGEDEDQQQ